MNSKKLIAKQLIFTIFSLTLFIMSAFGLVNITETPVAYATGITEVDITNSNFSASTSTTYPFSPSGFTQYVGDTESSSTTIHSSIKAGVVSLKSSSYSSSLEGANRGSSYDAYVLMIDSQTVETNLGYRSSTFSVEANSSYLITVDVYTNTSNKIVDLCLYSDSQKYASIENVSSKYGWTTCSFLISTADESSSLSLGMYMDGKGVALFDNISAIKINSADVASTNAHLDSNVSTYVNNSITGVTKYIPSSNGFENESLNTDKTSITNSDFIGNATSEEVEDSESATGYAYQIASEEKTYSVFSTKDDFITAKQNLTYRVRIKAKTKNISGSATLSLVPTDYDKDAVSTSISADSTFTNYDFFIKGNATKDVNFKLSFALGSSSTSTASGKLLIESIEIVKVTYSTYSNGSNQIDLVAHDYNDSIMLTNGDFSDVKIGDIESAYPATATSWTATTGSGTQYYGVVNTESSNFSIASSKIYGLLNPSAETNNNVLLMYNADADTLIFKSETKSLSANTYHRFKLNVITYDAPLKASLVTTKDGEEVVLSTLTINDNLVDWEQVELLIHTGDQALDVALKLELTTDGMGYAYIDNAMYDFPGINSTVFESAIDSSKLLKVDLDNILASSAKSNLFDGTATNVTTSMVDATVKTESGINPNDLYSSEFKKISNKNVFAIRAMADTYFTAESKIGFDLTSGKAYKISVSVYTQNLSANNSETDLEKIGAGFGLTGFEDETFSSIQSNNTWTTLTFYVQPDEDVTTYLTFSLGSTDAMCKGDAFFGDITILTEDDDDDLSSTITSLEESNTDKYVKVMKLTTDTEEDEDETDEDENSDDSTTSDTTSMWFYYIPSIIFAVAIVICVVGIMMRKIKWKKPHTKSKNDYDRSRSASKQLYMRQATTLRETKLRDLNKELATAHESRVSYENNYKQSLTKMRELKIKRASEEEIKALEKEMKKNQKLTSAIGVTISKLEREIAYVKTDDYLNSLTRKLSYQKTDDETEEK